MLFPLPRAGKVAAAGKPKQPKSPYPPFPTAYLYLSVICPFAPEGLFQPFLNPIEGPGERYSHGPVWRSGLLRRSNRPFWDYGKSAGNWPWPGS